MTSVSVSNQHTSRNLIWLKCCWYLRCPWNIMGYCWFKCRLCQNVSTLCWFRQSSSIQHNLHVARWCTMGNLSVSEAPAGDQTQYARIPTKVLVLECNWILFLGTALGTYAIRQAARGWYHCISERESAQSHTSPSSTCAWFHWSWRENIGWGYLTDGWAALWEVGGMDLNLVKQQRKLIPYHNLITHLSVRSKVPIGSVWAAEADALHGATYSLTTWLSKLNLSGLTVNIRFSLREPLQGGVQTLLKISLQPVVSTQPHVCLACVAIMVELLYLWSLTVLHLNVLLSMIVHSLV